MADRIQLNASVYMKLDNQWRICQSGCVIDVPTANNFSVSHATLLSPREAASTLASHGGATPVRNIR